MDSLRKAGIQERLFFGLLVRTKIHCALENFIEARQDLDEAREIVEESGMRLYLADVCLESARLSLAEWRQSKEEKYKRESLQSYEEGKSLVEKMGYRLRDREIRELEEQFLSLNFISEEHSTFNPFKGYKIEAGNV